jgi:hypothetical protein
MESWIDGTGTISGVSPNGDESTFSLRARPLEIFKMRTHLGMCLSLDEAIFFSVFANAADINKQVLSALDTKGNVVARALLALTDKGGILIFHAYSHDKQLEF